MALLIQQVTTCIWKQENMAINDHFFISEDMHLIKKLGSVRVHTYLQVVGEGNTLPSSRTLKHA